MKHCEFSEAMWELCDDISGFHEIEGEQVESLRQVALAKANIAAEELLAKCLANAPERERLVSDFYQQVIETGLIGSEELHEENEPTVGMEPELWRAQYLEDRIHRYGLVLLILQRAAKCDDWPDHFQGERKPEGHRKGYER